jgi:hypothetical protein
VRRSGRHTVVTAISAPAPPCRDLFGIFGEPGSPLPSLPVDRRGRFAGARRVRTDGIAAVSGRFLGARPRRATLRARWRAGPCRAEWGFRLRPVRRVAIPDGTYTGTHTGGGAISFEVVNTRREAYLFRLTPSPLFRCSDGSSYRISDYSRGTELAWIWARRHLCSARRGGRLAVHGARRPRAERRKRDLPCRRDPPGCARCMRHRSCRLQRESVRLTPGGLEFGPTEPATPSAQPTKPSPNRPSAARRSGSSAAIGSSSISSSAALPRSTIAQFLMSSPRRDP